MTQSGHPVRESDMAEDGVVGHGSRNKFRMTAA
jgi:hypothetical protein